MTTAEFAPGRRGELEDPGTRDRVRALVVSQGPIDAARLAEALELTPAGVRRHLQALVAAGEIAERSAPVGARRGRGRPAREYVATTAAQDHLADGSSMLATQALRHIAAHLGSEGVTQFAEERIARLEAGYRPRVDAAGPRVADRVRALAEALSEDGFAASIRVPPGSLPLLQLCQGHCPIQLTAAEFPELCEAETRMFARLLGVHVQRLATIAGGGHACTTTVPTLLPPETPVDEAATTAVAPVDAAPASAVAPHSPHPTQEGSV